MTRETLTWAFLARSGSERDLVEELGEANRPETLAEGVVVAAGRPKGTDHALRDPAFARQALRLDGPPAALEAEEVADRLTRAIRARLPRSGEPWTWALQVVAPDSRDPEDPRRRLAAALEPALEEALMARLPKEVREKREPASAKPNRVVQVWVLDEAQALVGVTSAQEAITLVPGGKIRMKRPEDAPSRAGLKLEEAIAWIGLGPDKGDLCVDLGAAPGGWSQVAVGLGATVIAVDPAKMKIDLPKSRFTHVQASAFDFAPSETLDWLLCDMAWRPLEVAKLIAKWGRRVWARQLVANFKLPMKKKAEILAEVLAILEDGGWRGVRTRQLYFDRDEVTVFAWLDPNVARKGVQAPFRLRSRERHEADEQRRSARGLVPRAKKPEGPRTGARSGRDAQDRAAPRSDGPRPRGRADRRDGRDGRDGREGPSGRGARGAPSATGRGAGRGAPRVGRGGAGRGAPRVGRGGARGGGRPAGPRRPSRGPRR